MEMIKKKCIFTFLPLNFNLYRDGKLKKVYKKLENNFGIDNLYRLILWAYPSLSILSFLSVFNVILDSSFIIFG